MTGRPLGERLEDAARAVAARHQMRYPWADRLVPVLRRAAQLTPTGRFERHELSLPSAGFDLAAPVPGTVPVPWAVPDSGAGPDSGAASDSGAGPAAAVPADVRARLAEVAGPGAEAMRVRADAAADSVSRAHRADAVTAGDDVYVRAGRFRPDEPDGFALLAHEAAHVTAYLGGAAPRAADGGGAEEDAALAVERSARRRFAAESPGAGFPEPRSAGGPPARVPRPGAPAPEAPAMPGAAGPVRVMRAADDRDAGGAPPFDVAALRRSLLADLARQLRSEFERGG